MCEEKTTLQFLRNQDWKKVKLKTEKVNKVLQLIPKDNITELNELICAGAKIVCNKINVLKECKLKSKNWMGNEMRTNK